jgi:hypothetical protein
MDYMYVLDKIYVVVNLRFIGNDKLKIVCYFLLSFIFLLYVSFL